MNIKKEVYEKFYLIFQEIFVDVEFPGNTWEKNTIRKGSAIHWEKKSAARTKTLTALLTGRDDDRYYYRFMKDYATFNVAVKNMPDLIVINTLKWLGAYLSEEYISLKGLSHNEVAKILFQFFWEHYDPEFLKHHPELNVFDLTLKDNYKIEQYGELWKQDVSDKEGQTEQQPDTNLEVQKQKGFGKDKLNSSINDESEYQTKYILSHWEAVELFARIVSKEGEPLETYYNYNKLLKHVIDGCKATYSSKLAKAINDAIKYNGDETNFLNGNEIQQLCLAIENTLPFIISDKSLEIIKEYIGVTDFLERIKTAKKWKVSPKQKDYQGTIWSIYCLDDPKIDQHNTEINTSVVSQGLLKLLPFNKAEILYRHFDHKKPVKYVGTYDFFEGDYLLIDMKTVPGQKNLKIDFYIGNDPIVNMAIGLYHNIYNNKIYSSTIMMIRENSEKKVQIRFYHYDNQKHKAKLNKDFIWDFFAEKKVNYLSVPTGNINKEQVELYLKNR